MRVGIDVPATAEALTAALEGLTAVNTELLRKGNYKPLYFSGVRYKAEPPGREQWQNVRELYRRGEGDCEDLAAARAAELRVRCAEPARAIAYRSGPRKFHAVVERADGRIEDPSRVLGM